MEMICILCPRGCHLTVEQNGEDKSQIEVSGNFCPRGRAYAIGELTHPVRTVTTSVYLEGEGRDKMLSVKTKKAVPKEKIPEILATVKGLHVKAPVNVGDVIVSDIAGSGSDLVATRRVR